MAYEVWNQVIERDGDMKKNGEFYKRMMVTEDLEEAREKDP